MITSLLGAAAASVLAARCVRLSQRTLALLTIFLPVPLGYSVAGVRGDEQLPRGRAKRKIWPYWHDALRHGRVMLTLESALYRLVIVPLGAFLPAPLAYKVACLRGDWRYRWDAAKREEVMRCLEDVLGDQLSITDRTRVTRDFFRQRSCQQIDVMRLAGKGRALARLVEIRGLEHIEAALAAGKGAILCFAHFGNFNGGLSLLGAQGFPITLMGRWATNKVDRNMSFIARFFYRLTSQRLLVRHRRRTNIEPLGQVGVAFEAATILRHNELLGIPIDPPVLAVDRTRAVPMDFLNGQALLLPGATTIAQLMGAPVLMMFLRRSADWRHQVLEISPPMPMDGDAVTAFRRCLAVVEAAIRQHPAHWHYWGKFALMDLGLLPKEPESAHEEGQQEIKRAELPIK